MCRSATCASEWRGIVEVVVRVAEPKSDKEAMLRLEAPVDDLKNPGVAHVIINGVEYVVEVYY